LASKAFAEDEEMKSENPKSDEAMQPKIDWAGVQPQQLIQMSAQPQ
jgi:hypothetical protein